MVVERQNIEAELRSTGLTRRRLLTLLGLAPTAAISVSPLLTSCNGERRSGIARAEITREEAIIPAAVRNVKSSEFGAVGDGIRDDTAAIQKAIDSLPDHDLQGGTVLFPVGHYKITSPLKVYGRSTRLVGLGGSSAIESAPGYGSVLVAATGGITLLEIGDNLAINQFGPTLENLSFVADTSATGVTLVKNRSTIQSTFKNCYFRHADIGVRFTSTLSDGGPGDSGWAYLEQCFFYDLEYGILGQNDASEEVLSNQYVLVGGGFTNCSYPIRIASGSGGARIFGPKLNDCDVGIYVGGSACQIFGVHIENSKLGINIESDGVIQTSGDANFVCGAVIVGRDGSSGDEVGIRIGRTATNTTVMNTDYTNLRTPFEDEGKNSLHMPLGGPLVLGGTEGDVLLRFARAEGSVADVRAEDGLVVDMGSGNAGDGFAIKLPSNTQRSRFEVRDGEDNELCSISGDGLLSLSNGGISLHSLQSTPRAPNSNGAVLFTRENGGKTELCARFSSGVEQVLATEP